MRGEQVDERSAGTREECRYTRGVQVDERGAGT